MQQAFQRFIQLHGTADLSSFCIYHLGFGNNPFRSSLRVFLNLFRCTFYLFSLRRCFLLFLVLNHIRHLHRLIRHALIPAVILFLLRWCQRLIFHLEFHSLIDIFSFIKPQDQIVTFFQTLCRQACLLVQFCQFISPLFDILCLFESFQSLNLLVDRRSLRTQDLITENKFIRILRRNLLKVIIIINCFIYILRLQCQCTKLVNDFPASFRTMISNIQDIITLLIITVFFINIADICQHLRIAHPLPVYAICNLRSLTKCTVLHKFKHLFCLLLILILVHCCSPHNLYFLSYFSSKGPLSIGHNSSFLGIQIQKARWL